MNVFQFHKGTIKTATGAAAGSAAGPISIP